MGRPQLVAGESKSVLIGARLSAAESKQVHAKIKQSGKVKSDWIRSRLLA